MGINATNAQSYYLESLKNRQSQNSYTLPNGYVDTPVFNNNVQQTAVDSFNNKTTTPADGKDDGSIGFLGALKNIGKGVVKFFTNMFTDENGDFSLKQTAKTLGMIGLITAATFIPVVGPLVLPALCAYGMVEGGLHVIKGVSNAMSATTDADAEQAWQDVGSGATEGVLSYVGYKQTGGFKAAFKKSGAQLDALMAEKPTVKTEQLAGESETVKSESSEVIEETNVKAEAEAKAKAEAEAKAKAEAEAKAKAEAEAKAKAEAEAKAKAEAEAKAKAEAEAKAKAEAEAKAKAEAEAKAKAEAEAKAKAEAEAKAKAEAETDAKLKVESEIYVGERPVEFRILDELDAKGITNYGEMIENIGLKETNISDSKFYHGTPYADIVKQEGFKLNIDRHGNCKLDGGNGIYLSEDMTGAANYGEVLEIKPNVKRVAMMDTYDSFIKMRRIENNFNVMLFKYLQGKGMTKQEINQFFINKSTKLFNEYLSRMFQNEGYDALYIKPNASTKDYSQLIVFNPKNLQII